MLSGLIGLGQDNPEKIPLININPDLVQGKTISGNIANADKAFDLASMVNAFSAEQLGTMLETMLPGYGKLRDKGTANIASLLRGEIPKDTERLLEQRAAERGVKLGTSGSGFESADLLRNLGLTSLQVTQQGLDSASRWIAQIPKAPQFDFTSMFYTPQQRLNFEFQQAQANVPIRKFNNWVDSLPSTGEAALGEFMDWIENTGRSVVEMYAGGAMGGMMGGTGGGGSSSMAGGSGSGGGNFTWNPGMSGYPSM